MSLQRFDIIVSGVFAVEGASGSQMKNHLKILSVKVGPTFGPFWEVWRGPS